MPRYLLGMLIMEVNELQKISMVIFENYSKCLEKYLPYQLVNFTMTRTVIEVIETHDLLMSFLRKLPVSKGQ